MFVDIRPIFARLPKAKTAKIVRSLIDGVGEAAETNKEKGKVVLDEDLVALQVDICRDAIEWCVEEKRTFLKQRMQSRLASLLLQMKKYKDALVLITKLVKEVKKFDDKLLMVEIELVESQVHLALENLPKAKGALTTARSSANSIYCPPILQAEIDLQAGTLCAEEGDYKTAFSYFYEAFEGYNTVGLKRKAILCLKYMLLGKIMTNAIGDVHSIINGKSGMKYQGVEINAMKAVADAYKNRSIHDFDAANKKYHSQLAEDPIIFSHLDDLKNKLLEENLLRLIEPFSRVEIAHVAKLIDLPQARVQGKLSEMILDKKLKGILDQGSGNLIVFDETDESKTYADALGTIKELSKVVDRLYTSAQKLSTV